jgi:integrase
MDGARIVRYCPRHGVTGQDGSNALPLEPQGNMLTDLSIKKLALPDKRREVPDGRIGGLYLIVQPSGAKSWAVRYRADGLPRKLTLGPYPAVDLATARKRAQEALGDVAGGKDPASAKQASKVTARAERADDEKRVERVAEAFLKRHVKLSGKVGAGWGAEIERLLKVEILPRIGAKQIGAVTKNDVLAILDSIVDRGSPITANRCFAVLRKFFNWAADARGLIVVSPCKGIEAPAAESSRDRVLDDAEIGLAWRAFESIGWPFGAIGKLLLLTGARRSEIADAIWHEIDLAAKTLILPGSRTKNGEPHEIPLSRSAVEIIEALPPIEGRAGLVFSTTGKTPVSGFSRSRELIEKAMLAELRMVSIERGEDPGAVEGPKPWTLHDLRRTCASGMARLNIAPHIVEAVLNHKSGTIKGVAAVYNRYSYAAEKRQALDAWARRVNEIITGEVPANVVDLAKARG